LNTFWKIFSTRRFFWALLAVPGIWRLVIPALTNGLGFNPLFELLHRTGQIAIWLLVIVLSLTPLKTLFPRPKLINALNRHRRAIGVAAFIYASLHMMEHFLYEGELKGYFRNFWQPFFLAGTFGITVLTLLAVTSNNFSVKRLGYHRWKWLHRLVYFAALALIWHVGTVGKGNWPFAKRVFIPLLVLQLLRVGKLGAERVRKKITSPRGPNQVNPDASASTS
jgi:sulfoxide reductase heme-binding subunit YedZ